MKITKNTVVTLRYRLGNLKAQGRHLPPEQQEMVYLHGGYEGTLPRVEEALEGLSVGDTIELELAPKDHFGEYNEALVRLESRDVFPPEIEVGTVLEGHNPVTGAVVLFHVTRIEGNQVTVDANHPLAGQTLQFSATVLNVRAASEEEIAHGHVHGEGGHHH